MRLLVLGGTRFLSYTVAADAVARGHEVVCAARGSSGAVPDGARLVHVDRDAPDGLAPLRGETFDAVVDVAKISYPWVERALEAVRADHWTFVSSVSVYADMTAAPTGVGDPVLPARREHAEGIGDDPTQYGSVKVASEQAVVEAYGDRAFVVRAGLITGPGDVSDRFGYWPARFAQPARCGGRVLVPDTDHASQYVDVRDLATWIVDAGTHGLGGTFDAIGPAEPLSALLAAMAGEDVELVRVAPQALVGAGVNYWAGPRSLPLWLPGEDGQMCGRPADAALTAGLRPRPLADAVAGALAHERALGLDRERRAGLSEPEEQQLLDTLAPA